MAPQSSLSGVPQPGEVLSGKYEIERVLGVGGMGVVLAARHVTLGQRVAIKFLLPDLAARQSEAVERFLREARASIHLRSENVARVIDVDKASNGAPYMVLEYLDGRDLNQVLREQKQLSVPIAVEFVLQAAEALAEAHSLGIVHRDLKPANLFLTARADGSPLIKVLDFGISKAMASGERGITSTQAVMGSPGYMSPEQVRSSKHVDQRTDVWSLGVILYEFLSGVPPFDGDSVPALSAQIVTETPKALPSLRREIPAALDLVVQRCLAKDVGQRYHNMAELARALSPFVPPGAQIIVERIVRIASTSAAHAPTLNADSAQMTQGTQSAFAQTAPAPAPGGSISAQRRRGLLAVALVTVVAGVVIAVFIAGQRSAGSDAPALANTAAGDALAPSRVGSSPVPSPVAAVSAVSATPAVALAPTGSAAASAAALVPTATSSKPSRSAVPRAPQCAKGQSLSSGHCCPNGLTWQNGRCDRPLATTLP
ncbi:MAG TPA: serine/threonine-protein kinase [Polyangiaceae bacterium]|nr:serine/threonine-protein kinase [Polyangiaceae bacterium]